MGIEFDMVEKRKKFNLKKGMRIIKIIKIIKKKLVVGIEMKMILGSEGVVKEKI